MLYARILQRTAVMPQLTGNNILLNKGDFSRQQQQTTLSRKFKGAGYCDTSPYGPYPFAAGLHASLSAERRLRNAEGVEPDTRSAKMGSR